MSSDHGGNIDCSSCGGFQDIRYHFGDHRKIGVNIEAPYFGKDAICNC